ncbi:receptor-like protein kinase [Hibiscus syriacus]|uniref:Receptor-like protein kinase n=1 Tax=Hibiscus syriacus TaxID=106335 RepID=A0A6A2ZSC2_HIBSY|nr:receptor-like protein kinase [Hibiscus syriacus]
MIRPSMGKAMDRLVALLLVSFSLLFLNQPTMPLLPKQYDDICESPHIPFPFHLNASCPSIFTVIRLSCLNSTTLYLHIGTETYRFLDFLSDGVLVDFPGTTGCRQYNDLNGFGFTKNDYFGISNDNVIGLYDFEDSSLCKTGYETKDLPGCDGNYCGSITCCYPLFNHSIWHFNDGFSSFSKFRCRGFSSWLVARGSNTGKRGVKLEWVIPRNSYDRVRANDAYMVNVIVV